MWNCFEEKNVLTNTIFCLLNCKWTLSFEKCYCEAQLHYFSSASACLTDQGTGEMTETSINKKKWHVSPRGEFLFFKKIHQK